MKWKGHKLKEMNEQELKLGLKIDFFLSLLVLGMMGFISIFELVNHFVFGNAYRFQEVGLGFFGICFAIVAILLVDMTLYHVELRIRELKP